VKRAVLFVVAVLLAAAAGASVFRGEPRAVDKHYVPPVPGSYDLPVIQRLRDHPLVEAGGRSTTFFDLKGKRLAIVAFIYTACPDATGCPLSQATLLSLDRAIAADPALRATTVLVTMSFDRERDTPQRLHSLRETYAPRSDWRFVTAPNDGALGEMLEDFGQPVTKLALDDGTWSGRYRHVLKVFLVDRENGVRNVYSTGFLDRDLVLGDLRTLAATG
jgi:cytochrome oxidase Cu insertion factor (SCO1/SenC/PrrC family)